VDYVNCFELLFGINYTFAILNYNPTSHKKSALSKFAKGGVSAAIFTCAVRRKTEKGFE